MRIAVIGSGISGLGAALALHRRPGTDLTLFEKEPRPGGHAHTIDVDDGGRSIPVDTGFIVYNELNYPNLTALFSWAGVDTIASDMSFALSSDDGALEWAGRHSATLSGLFAQRHNLVDPGFYRFLLGIRRFQQQAIRDVAKDSIGDVTLAGYLAGRNVSDRVRDDYVVPMGAAIWSMTPGETLAFPARAFMAFFDNHKLLQWDRPRWRTVRNGSWSYVRNVAAHLASAVRTSTPVKSVRRVSNGVIVVDAKGHEWSFDVAILATHAPVSLGLLADPTECERSVLGAFRTSKNRVVVHRDVALMPRRRAAWAAWNVLRRGVDGGAAVTYWMNRLQSLPEECPLFVTLNPDRVIDPAKVFATFSYDHPVYDAAAIAAQARLPSIQGTDRLWFAGAWTGYGFHEDGLRSGLAAAQALGGIAPWLR